MCTTMGRVSGIVLAGGQSRRFGRDKRDAVLAGQTLLKRVIDRAQPQVGRLVVAAGADGNWAGGLGIPAVVDPVPGAGPLGGVLAGLEWAARQRFASPLAVTFTTDCPFVPADLVERLGSALARDGTAQIAVAATHARVHPGFCLLPVSAASDLRAFLRMHGNPSLFRFLSGYRVVEVVFPWAAGRDPFFNINSASDLDAAEELLRSA